MIDIREHGGIYSGKGAFVKFPKVTFGVAGAFPSNPQKDDIFIETTISVNNIVFAQDTANLNTDDAVVLFSNLEEIKTVNEIKYGNKKMPLVIGTVPSGKQKILSTNFYDVYAKLIGVKIQTTYPEPFKAYYWDGTQWVKFSDVSNYFVGESLDYDGFKIRKFDLSGTLIKEIPYETANDRDYVEQIFSIAYNPFTKRLYVGGNADMSIFDEDLNFVNTLKLYNNVIPSTYANRFYIYPISDGRLFVLGESYGWAVLDQDGNLIAHRTSPNTNPMFGGGVAEISANEKYAFMSWSASSRVYTQTIDLSNYIEPYPSYYVDGGTKHVGVTKNGHVLVYTNTKTMKVKDKDGTTLFTKLNGIDASSAEGYTLQADETGDLYALERLTDNTLRVAKLSNDLSTIKAISPPTQAIRGLGKSKQLLTIDKLYVYVVTANGIEVFDKDDLSFVRKHFNSTSTTDNMIGAISSLGEISAFPQNY